MLTEEKWRHHWKTKITWLAEVNSELTHHYLSLIITGSEFWWTGVASLVCRRNPIGTLPYTRRRMPQGQPPRNAKLESVKLASRSKIFGACHTPRLPGGLVRMEWQMSNNGMAVDKGAQEAAMEEDERGEDAGRWGLGEITHPITLEPTLRPGNITSRPPQHEA